MIEAMLRWVDANEALLGWLAGLSVLVFLASLATVPWLMCRIPVDYFRVTQRPALPWSEKHPVIRWPLLLIKNLTGLLLFAAGVTMLVLPGQGLLTMLAGLVLIDFPGKFRFERWLIRWPVIFNSVNWLRGRHGRAPLHLPDPHCHVDVTRDG